MCDLIHCFSLVSILFQFAISNSKFLDFFLLTFKTKYIDKQKELQIAGLIGYWLFHIDWRPSFVGYNSVQKHNLYVRRCDHYSNLEGSLFFAIVRYQQHFTVNWTWSRRFVHFMLLYLYIFSCYEMTLFNRIQTKKLL